MKSYLLEEKAGHIATYHEVDESCSKLVVCFSPNGRKMQKSRGFSSDFCEKKGWNFVYIGCAENTFFASLNADDLCKMLEPFRNGRDVVTYGSSAGGFAALWFGGFLNARIISASPRNFLHELLVPNQRDNPDAPMNVWLTDAPRAEAAPTIIYDPTQRIDHVMVEDWALPAYPNATIINIPNGGHHTLDRLKQAGALSKVISLLVNGEAPIIKETYFKEGTLGWYQDMAVLHLTNRRYADARNLLCEYAAAHPGDTYPILQMLVAATFNAPSQDAIQILKDAVSKLDLTRQRLKGKSISQLRALQIAI